MSKPKWCQHCCVRRVVRPRGLCSPCYYRPEVMAKYPPKPSYTPEPTAEEIDRIVAEQMACLPSWWPKSGVTDTED